LLILYAFVGFENSVVPAGRTADARRTIPRALIATIIATAALYFLVQLAMSQ
jgi:amino acid transporter